MARATVLVAFASVLIAVSSPVSCGYLQPEPTEQRQDGKKREHFCLALVMIGCPGDVACTHRTVLRM